MLEADNVEVVRWLSVIVPVYQEPCDELQSLFAWIEESSNPQVEWIIVCSVGDESSISLLFEIKGHTRRNRMAATTQGARLNIEVIKAPKGRSKQMNAGAKQASGKVLLFLHADTRLGEGWIDSIEGTFQGARAQWGAFAPRIAGQGVVYRVAEQWGLWRSQALGLPYGDQAMFVDTGLFWELGGFDEDVQFMEDVDLAGRLCRLGLRPLILPLEAFTSNRKWAKHGLWHSIKNFAAFVLSMLGIPRDRIRQWYISQ